MNLLIHSKLVSKPRLSSMNIRTPQLLRPNDLPRRHLHQRRSSEKCLSLVLHKDAVVRQRGVVGSSGRRGSKHNGARRLSLERADGQVVEELAAFVEDAELLGEEDAGLGGRLAGTRSCLGDVFSQIAQGI